MDPAAFRKGNALLFPYLRFRLRLAPGISLPSLRAAKQPECRIKGQGPPAVLTFADIILLVLHQKAHDGVFRLLPLLLQPLEINLLAHPHRKLVIEIQQLIEGLVAQEACVRTHHQRRKVQTHIRRIGLAVIQPKRHHITVSGIDGAGQHPVQHVLVLKAVDLLPFFVCSFI